MWSLAVLNLGLPANSELVGNIPYIWVLFFVLYAVMIVGMFSMVIGLLAAGLEESHSAEKKGEAAEEEYQEEILQKGLQAKLAAGNGRQHTGKGSTDTVPVSEIRVFLQREALVPDAKLTKVLEERGLTAPTLFKALEHLEIVAAEQGKLSVSRFLGETFGLDRPVKRCDVLESLAENRCTVQAFAERNARLLTQRLTREDADASALGAQLSMQEELLTVLQEQLHHKDRAVQNMENELQRRQKLELENHATAEQVAKESAPKGTPRLLKTRLRGNSTSKPPPPEEGSRAAESPTQQYGFFDLFGGCGNVT